MVFLTMMKTGLEMIKMEAEPKEIFIELLIIGAPLFLVVWVLVTILTFVGYGMQVGFLFSPKVIQPKFNNINPANYFKNVFNFKKSGFELFKNLAMLGVMGSVIYNVFVTSETKIQGALFSTWFDSVLIFDSMLTEFTIKIGVVFLLLGILDYFYQKYEYENSLKMKKQEVKDENKNQQGNPEVKNQQRMARRRIMEKQVKQTVIDAQMVIVNPTHYAVVVRYKKKKGDSVPRVTLKGIDEKALIIKELAKENKIPIVENKKLARQMYAEIKEDDYISEEMYEIIGKILAKLVRENKTKIDSL
jgi:flagellar biosynthetic protein FlhB